MAEWRQNKIDVIKDSISKSSTTYATAVTQVVSSSTPTQQLSEEISALDSALKTLTTAHTDWKKGPVAEVTKIVG